jgi:hypothetical protein
VAALVAGCASAVSSTGPATAAGAASPASSASPSSASPSSASPSSASPNSASPSAPANSAASGRPASAGVPLCRTADLKVTKGAMGAAAGSVYLQIDFTNTSGAACTLYGYPGIALTTSTTTASQVGLAATRSTGQPYRVVTLAPKASASATLHLARVVNYPAARCGPVSGSFLQVYPPGQKTAVYLSYQGQTCAKPVFAMGIGAVQPGTAPGH